MKKVGQMVVAGEPELSDERGSIHWKVPLLVVPPDGDSRTYPTRTHALVDAVSGLYSMSRREVEQLEAASEPILQRLYPELEEWIEEAEKAR